MILLIDLLLPMPWLISVSSIQLGSITKSILNIDDVKSSTHNWA